MKTLMIFAFATVAVVWGWAGASETVEGAKKDYAKAKAEVAAQLDSLDKKIDELKASTATKSTAMKEKTLAELQETRAKLHSDYELMKDTTASNWKAFKKSLSQSIDKLNAKAQKALSDEPAPAKTTK